MKITLRRSSGGALSAYVPKKDLEQPVVGASLTSLWGGQITLGNGWVLELPALPADTPLPITVEARKVPGT